jgi:hypothetical protein
MVLVRINEHTLVQKVKKSILGQEKPGLFTRISVWVGFVVWLYFTVWQILIFLSIVLVNRLENPEMIKSTFNRIGNKYAFMHRWGLDTMNTLWVHSAIILFFYGISLLGLIFIYRKKRRGYIVYFLSSSMCIIFTLVFLGVNYLNEQISLIDKLIFVLIMLYFLISLFFLKKIK